MSVAACPGCAAAPMAADIAAQGVAEGDIILSLPGIHCAACIGAVERVLLSFPGVERARVNLSRKRATVHAPGLAAAPLIAALESAGHAAQELDSGLLGDVDHDATGRGLLVRLAVAGFAMMNVMLFSVAVWSGAAHATQVMFHWMSAAIAVPALVFAAQVFFSHAWQALRVGRLNMDVPISLAIILATAMSVFETARGGDHVYFDAALSLTFFLLAGRYLDHRMRLAARSAARELTALEIPQAIRVDDAGQRMVRVADLAVGDRILLAVGMRAPVDGRVVAGQSAVDRSLLTGESLSVALRAGDDLMAGDVKLDGPLTLCVTTTGEDTTLRRLAALVELAESGRNRYTALADRAAQIYAPAVHLLALATFLGWLVGAGDVLLALNIAISVLIITCPCALGLAVPAVMTAASGRLFRQGLLVKNGTALERLAEVDTIIFDKTGTLTRGHAALDTSGLSAQDLSVLAALTAGSQHPVSRACAAAMSGDVRPAALTAMAETAGLGVSALWQGVPVRFGRGDWVGATGSPALRIGDRPAIVLPYRESLRDGAAEAVAALQALGLDLRIMSGDGDAAVGAIADALRITQVQAQMRPDDKLAAVAALEDAGHRVLMIGDGLNDTAALTRAHASMSPAQALDAARVASDIVVLGQSLGRIPEALQTARMARTLVRENFAIAAGYNVIAVPVAVIGLASPLAAAVAMSVSSITVLLNALRVR